MDAPQTSTLLSVEHFVIQTTLFVACSYSRPLRNNAGRPNAAKNSNWRRA